ncbi:hypothetical protein ACU686_44610 [Yinghuangia aomiensis]
MVSTATNPTGDRRTEHRGHADRSSSGGPGPSATGRRPRSGAHGRRRGPRARGALRVPPGEDGPPVVDPDEEAETTVRLVETAPTGGDHRHGRGVAPGHSAPPRDGRDRRDGREAADVPGPREPRDTAWSPHRSSSGTSGTSDTSGSDPAADPSEHSAPLGVPVDDGTRAARGTPRRCAPVPGPRSAAARTGTRLTPTPWRLSSAAAPPRPRPSAPSAPASGDSWRSPPPPPRTITRGFGGGMRRGFRRRPRLRHLRPRRHLRPGALSAHGLVPGSSPRHRMPMPTPHRRPSPLPTTLADPHQGPCDSSALEPVGVRKALRRLGVTPRPARHRGARCWSLNEVRAEAPADGQSSATRSKPSLRGHSGSWPAPALACSGLHVGCLLAAGSSRERQDFLGLP